MARSKWYARCRSVFLQPRKTEAGGLVSVHRLAIFDASGDVVSIISQLDILRRAHSHAPWPSASTAMEHIVHVNLAAHLSHKDDSAANAAGRAVLSTHRLITWGLC